MPFIFKKYAGKKKVNLTVVDIDNETIELLKVIYDRHSVPQNFHINFVCADYMKLNHKRVDLIIGNPPFSKINGEYRMELLKNNYNKESTNLSEFILEKAILNSDFVSMIMPKNLLNTPEFARTREILSGYKVDSIVDFGENGFKGVLVETINIMMDTLKRTSLTKVISMTLKQSILQRSQYIFDKKLPYWVIYRDAFFDRILSTMEFDVFDVFRDRQITKNNTRMSKDVKYSIRVLKSRNILDDGNIINIDNYDSYIDRETLSKLSVYKYLDSTNVYLTPNMTYKPRLIKKSRGYIVNGSVAILIPKNSDIDFSREQLDYIASEEFRKFYKIARNYQTRSLNIDKTSCYWFGLKKLIYNWRKND